MDHVSESAEQTAKIVFWIIMLSAAAFVISVLVLIR
jgi:hypothetical protein